MTTLAPLLPAFHPDYKPPVGLKEIIEKEIATVTSAKKSHEVPRFKHAASYDNSLKSYEHFYEMLLPAYHSDQSENRDESSDQGFSQSESSILPAYHPDLQVNVNQLLPAFDKDQRLIQDFLHLRERGGLKI